MNKKAQTFWQAFFLGVILGSSSLYFFGTKKGRSQLKDLLDVLDKYDLEEEIHNLLEKKQEKATSVKNIIQQLSTKINIK